MEFVQNPKAIEDISMSIIEDALPNLRDLPVAEKEIIKRIVHTTGDFNIASLVRIHPKAVKNGLQALAGGKTIFTDVQMLKAGINRRKIEAFGINVLCKINDPEIVAEARETGKTRAMTAIARVASELEGGIMAIGNAPTALFELCSLYKAGKINPALVVGTPVGFVGAKESKEILMEVGLPYVTVEGTRGGSTIAVAVINALLKLV